MDKSLLLDLHMNETDVDGALNRLAGHEEIYLQILAVFPDDPTMADLSDAIGAEDWDRAFTAAHALKGLAGNLGFAPLFYSLSQLVILIRTGRIDELDDVFRVVEQKYEDIIAVIHHHKMMNRLMV